jgi:hypothetical protein
MSETEARGHEVTSRQQVPAFAEPQGNQRRWVRGSVAVLVVLVVLGGAAGGAALAGAFRS